MKKRDRVALRRQFTDEGYVVLPRLFERRETASWKGEIRRILEEVARDAGGEGRRVEEHFKVGVHVGLAARSAVFREAVADPRLLDVIAAICWPNIEFLSDKVVFKSADTEFGSPWHQDWPYWEGAHKLSVWIPLDDATEANGTLRVLPGSHREPVVHDGDASDGLGFGNRLDPSSVDESEAVTVELEAGGAIFFHDLLLHASHPNRSGEDRWVWIPTYRDAAADDRHYAWSVAARVVRTETPELDVGT